MNIVNDIALFKLATPVTFSKTIKPVCLPATANYRPGKLSIITGWVNLFRFNSLKKF